MTFFKRKEEERNKGSRSAALTLVRQMMNIYEDDGERCEFKKEQKTEFVEICSKCDEYVDTQLKDCPQETINFLCKLEKSNDEDEEEDARSISVYTSKPHGIRHGVVLAVSDDDDIFYDEYLINGKRVISHSSLEGKKTGNRICSKQLCSEFRAINPVSGKKMEIITSSIVKQDVGTGCVMLAPGISSVDFLALNEPSLEEEIPLVKDLKEENERVMELLGDVMSKQITQKSVRSCVCCGFATQPRRVKGWFVEDILVSTKNGELHPSFEKACQPQVVEFWSDCDGVLKQLLSKRKDCVALLSEFTFASKRDERVFLRIFDNQESEDLVALKMFVLSYLVNNVNKRSVEIPKNFLNTLKKDSQTIKKVVAEVIQKAETNEKEELSLFDRFAIFQCKQVMKKSSWFRSFSEFFRYLLRDVRYEAMTNTGCVLLLQTMQSMCGMILPLPNVDAEIMLVQLSESEQVFIQELELARRSKSKELNKEHKTVTVVSAIELPKDLSWVGKFLSTEMEVRYRMETKPKKKRLVELEVEKTEAKKK